MEYGPGGSATFLYYFTSTAIIFAFITAQSLGTGMTGLPQQVGLVGGIVGGLLGTYFNRTIALSVEEFYAQQAEQTEPKKGKKEKAKKAGAIAKELPKILENLGYQPISESAEENLVIYQRTGLSKFLSGKIFVYTEDGKTTVASRAIHIRALKRLL